MKTPTAQKIWLDFYRLSLKEMYRKGETYADNMAQTAARSADIFLSEYKERFPIESGYLKLSWFELEVNLKYEAYYDKYKLVVYQAKNKWGDFVFKYSIQECEQDPGSEKEFYKKIATSEQNYNNIYSAKNNAALYLKNMLST